MIEYYGIDTDSAYIRYMLADCLQSGELINTDNGQFCGGIQSETYRYAGYDYCFCWDNHALISMTKKHGVAL